MNTIKHLYRTERTLLLLALGLELTLIIVAFSYWCPKVFH